MRLYTGQKKLITFCELWEKGELHLFFFPPCPLHLNIAEILWRMIKGKWLQSHDYFTSGTRFYVSNRVLAATGEELTINFKNHVA